MVCEGGRQGGGTELERSKIPHGTCPIQINLLVKYQVSLDFELALSYSLSFSHISSLIPQHSLPTLLARHSPAMASHTLIGIAQQLPTDQVREAVEGDPIRRYSVQEDKHPGIRERVWGLDARTDPTVTFEEFRYWAKIERELEDQENRTYKETRGPRTLKSTIAGRFSKGVHHENAKRAAAAKEAGDEKSPAVIGESAVGPSTPSTVAVTDAEWRTAARALRTASWGSIFFLVTTDILGWSGAP